jgi:hypothetical protein
VNIGWACDGADDPVMTRMIRGAGPALLVVVVVIMM